MTIDHKCFCPFHVPWIDHELSESEMIYNSVLSNPKTSLLSVGRAKSRQQFFKVHPDKINIKL